MRISFNPLRESFPIAIQVSSLNSAILLDPSTLSSDFVSTPFVRLRPFGRGIYLRVLCGWTCLSILFFLLGCGTLPELSPVVPLDSEQRAVQIRACEEVFPPVPARFVHSVGTSFAGGRKGMMLGVTLIRPQENQIHAVMMTIEGLVMFDGRWEAGEVTIDRGVPPFDSPHFARGLLEDIRLVFLPPKGAPSAVGIAGDGTPVCRYQRDGGATVDVIADPADGWRIHRYVGGRRVRTVQAESILPVSSPEPFSISRKISLSAQGQGAATDYALTLTLLEAEPVMDSGASEDSETDHWFPENDE